MTSRGQAGRAGFALVQALLLLGILGAGIATIGVSVRALIGQADVGLAEAQDRLAMEAATTRALFALRTANDPMRRELLERRTVPGWRFADRPFAVALAPEGGRVDLNHAGHEILSALFQGIASSQNRADSWLDAATSMREAGRRIQSPGEILDACEFLGREGFLLSSGTTVWTRVKSVDPRWIEPGLADLLAANGGAELRSSLSAALASPTRFVADRFVDVSPPVHRLTVSRLDRGPRSYRRSAVLRWEAQGGLRHVANEDWAAGLSQSRCGR